MPRASHFRPATCAEVDCVYYLEGWVSVIDEATDLGQARAYYFRHQQTRSFTESRREVDGVVMTVFTFAPGQRCFRTHEKALARPQIHISRRGDWRGIIGERFIYDRPDQWQEDLALHLDVLKRAQE